MPKEIIWKDKPPQDLAELEHRLIMSDLNCRITGHRLEIDRLERIKKEKLRAYKKEKR